MADSAYKNRYKQQSSARTAASHQGSGRALQDNRPVSQAVKQLKRRNAVFSDNLKSNIESFSSMGSGRVLQDNRPVSHAVKQLKENNTGLPDNLKSGIENLSGMSMDSVKVHYNSSKPAQLNALAYAQGTDIHVAPGQEKHLPHEAWHVVQQAQGRVKPTMQMKDGVPVNDDKGLEREADLMGGEAIMQRASKSTESSPIYSPIIQMVQWQATDTTPAAGLTAELQAGYILANANPGAPPAMPAWVIARAEQAAPWDPVVERATSDLCANTAWLNLPAKAIPHIPDQAAWLLEKSNKDYNNRMAVHQAQWTVTANARWLTASWNDAWNNQDGDLPGVAGAGGYAEYYAQPTGAIAAEGFWGRNRIIRETTGAGTYANNWWATSDHYNSFTRIT